MILVFGKTGQVAQEIALNAGQREIVFLGRDAADLTNPEQCQAAIETHRPQAVINAAAYTAVDRAEDEAETAMAVNGTTVGAIARTCSALGIPLVHISTDYVFDGSGEAPHQPEDATHPINTYGRTKLAGETAIRASTCRHAIMRTSWVFSAHGNNFVKTMLRLSETRDALNVVDDQIGGPTPAADIARACLHLADRLMAGEMDSATLHFGGSPDVSWAGFAREIFSQAGRSVTVTGIPTSDYPTPAKRPLNSRMDCSSLSACGLERPDWRAGLRDVLNSKEISS
nr:dTDP-4-dehydrorhamnose reductase [uncultured Ruegeria sp.]